MLPINILILISTLAADIVSIFVEKNVIDNHLFSKSEQKVS